MEREEVRAFVNQYCHLRDVQYAAYAHQGNTPKWTRQQKCV